ncbi:MAG: HAD-IA family hydrolase [Ignavibacteriales bacterium]|nr:HAD-IA family hydrolase [Ignavibacteriales bacterium]
MSDLKCIIFDMDGTLTQTNRLIFDSFNYIAKKYQGRIYSEPEITAMFGPPEEGALLAIVGENQIDEAMKEERHLALFTGKGIHTTTITLEEFHLTKYFNFVVTGNDVVKHKPSAEGIQKILTHFSLKPNEVLMVGDSVGDAKASHEAGVKIASVLWDSYAKEKVLQMNSDYVFHNVQEFYQWLRQHFD